ncbi:NAD(P)/FAD-dependent oxidoreductase [Jannaschia aquimarina]|uniref:Uncharacterized protein n=1 Tax=Jannaschia aquimarina TaxID=935700 RepID=A0A0D1CRE0_9RHOB|nr:aminoacetone oxidase family FAD-binding enzyme [Jannaschia aquimarina]KIT17322.1 hypothetical protein jaqu_10530 [Jannaschia aquimarina]SNT20288.1 hypothetical protein SAMN05421775_107179 [Jannaschia aquimarina]
MKWDVIILGAGAAGLMAGLEAARRGRRTLVLDHGKRPGEKIRISGGGRCNFTNLNISRATIPERFLSANPRFALSALSRFPARAFLDRIEAAGIAWAEKALGQLFCQGSAKEVVAMLTDDLRAAGGVLRLDSGVTAVEGSGPFTIRTGTDDLETARVVVATGGLSIPKMGASDIGYRIARSYGLPIIDTRAGLVPLTFSGVQKDAMAEMSGTSVDAAVTAGQARFSDGLLFTHRGLSGPSILQASSYWRAGEEISVDLAANADIAPALAAQRQAGGRMGLVRALSAHLPERVARDAVARSRLDGNLADQSNRALDRLAAAVHDWRLTPQGSEGYRTAEVTLGGVDTAALDPRTMEARAVPGLHFVGEVVDVTGWLGGYNFQWAWASGWAAGQAV